MSPVQRQQAINSVVERLRVHASVSSVQVEPRPFAGLGHGDEVLSYDAVKVGLNDHGRRNGAKAEVVQMFWRMTSDLKLPQTTILLEVDGEPRPYFDPPV